MSTGLIHDDADTGSPSSIGGTVPQPLGDRLTSFGDRLHVVESELKVIKLRMVHYEETINLKKDALVSKFDVNSP